MQTLQRILADPRQLLLVDASGAIATAAATYFLLARQVIPTGLPFWLLCAMSAGALGFAVFDIAAYAIRVNPASALAIIAKLNATYCVGTVMSLIVFRNQVTGLGVAYFAVEILIVLSIAWWEYQVAARSQNAGL